jgi:hypothetical protein
MNAAEKPKPCDLTEIRRLAEDTRSGDIETLVGVHVPIMSAEIKAWRRAAGAVFDADIAGDRDAIDASLEDLRALLPVT